MSAADHDRIPEIALAWIDAGKPAALATVVETWGSAPRPVGSQLAVNADAEIMGSVSGGCVEGAVVAEALEALEDGKPRVLEFGVSDDQAFAVGLACGGRIRVMVEPIGVGQGPDVQMIRDLCAARAARRAAAYVVDIDSWDRLLMDGAAGCPLGHAVREAFRADRSGFSPLEDGHWFIGVHNPPLRLAVVGAVHIAQPLMTMARALGYDATLIDPRDAFGSAARFPGERIVHEWPDAALAACTPGMDASASRPARTCAGVQGAPRLTTWSTITSSSPASPSSTSSGAACWPSRNSVLQRIAQATMTCSAIRRGISGLRRSADNRGNMPVLLRAS